MSQPDEKEGLCVRPHVNTGNLSAKDAAAGVGHTGLAPRVRILGPLLYLMIAVCLWGCDTGLQPALTPTQVQMDSNRAFPLVSSSMAYVETATREGSGILIEGGYIVTNAQVVWPFQAVRVVLADGTQFPDVPVRESDLLADLAVLGPINAPYGGIALANEESIRIGLDSVVIGYKETTEGVPKLVTRRRKLAGIREFESTGITYLQTDAYLPSTGGAPRDQPGWVLVSTSGDVIGVVGFRPAGTNFEVAASSADILPRVTQLIAGGDPSELGDRKISVTGGESRHDVTPEHFLAQRTYVINELPGTEISIEFEGPYGGRLGVRDSLSGSLIYLSKNETQSAEGSFVLQSEEPHFAIVWRLGHGPGSLTVSSSHRLIELHDPDDGRRLPTGESVRGNTDFPGDIDYFLFDLKEGATVEVKAISLMIDTVLNVYPMRSDGQIDFDIDAETILFRSDSITVYRAPFTGNYFAVVARASNEAPGGYVLRLDHAGPDLALTYTSRASGVRSPRVSSTPAR